MTAYYNEIDPYAAQWLRNLIAFDYIAPGDVDERSIEDVRPDDLKGYDQCHFFAGIGVWSYALRRAGWPDDRPVWTGSCPCQPFSVIGKGKGTADERHLWPAWEWLIRHRRPEHVFGEQVASADGLAWLDGVYADLEAQGYAVGALDLCAAGVGAPHIRQRLYFVGNSSGEGLEGLAGHGDDPTRRPIASRPVTATSAACGWWQGADWVACSDDRLRAIEPGSFPLVDGAPSRVGRLRAYGNAIVAPLAEEVIRAYMQ